MELCLLGSVEARIGGDPVNLGVRKQRLVFAVLALGANQPAAMERLVDLVWPDDPPATARGMVHSYISRLRSALSNAGADRNGVWLGRVDSGYLLRCDPVDVDAHRFTELLADARASTQDEDRLALLDRALVLWRGPALAGIVPPQVRARLCQGLEEARLAAVEDRAEIWLRLAWHDRLVDELVTLTGEYPCRPRLTGALMLALHRTGRTGEALGVYQRVRHRLDEELGLEPPAELRDLQMAILRGERGAVAPARSDRPPTVAVPRQLPADVTTFTGRTGQLRRLRTAPRSSTGATAVRVIDGMPGVGKSALAVRTAHQLTGRYPDGQMFLDLHGFSEGIPPLAPADALNQMLRSLGIPTERIPADLDGRAALLRTRLANRRMLILLDNAGTESQVRPLLPGGPGCLVLVTSRRRLSGLDDARSMSLDVPSAADAARLFTRVAGIRSPSAAERAQVRTIVELCGRLPLAIRIAAARLSARPTWNPAHLVDLLRDGPDRLAELEIGQRSVAVAFGLSYRGLGPEARRVFRLLGLLPGPDFDADAAAALAGGPVRCARGLLEELVDAHLLQPARGGYRLHALLGHHARRLVRAEGAEPDRLAALVRPHRRAAPAVASAGV